MIVLEEATFDDIFKELRSRFPKGVVLIVERTPESQGDEGDEGEEEDDPITLAYHKASTALGLAVIAVSVIRRAITSCLKHRDLEDGLDEEDQKTE